MRAVPVVVSAAPEHLSEVARDALRLELPGIVRGRVAHDVQVLLARFPLLAREKVPGTENAQRRTKAENVHLHEVIVSVPGDDAQHLVPAVRKHGDPLLGESDVLDVGVELGVLLLDGSEHQEAVAVRGEERVGLDVEPGVFKGPFRVRLDAGPVRRQAGGDDAQVLGAVHPHDRDLLVRWADPSGGREVVVLAVEGPRRPDPPPLQVRQVRHVQDPELYRRVRRAGLKTGKTVRRCLLREKADE